MPKSPADVLSKVAAETAADDHEQRALDIAAHQIDERLDANAQAIKQRGFIDLHVTIVDPRDEPFVLAELPKVYRKTGWDQVRIWFKNLEPYIHLVLPGRSDVKNRK